MPKFTSPLDNVKVAAPCPADWNRMSGDERTRFCAECQLNVYNLSAMTKPEAEKLLREREGRLCVRFYRRADGAILTANCPRGLARIKQRARRIATAAFSAVAAFVSGLGLQSAANAISAERVYQTQGAIAVLPVESLQSQEILSEEEAPLGNAVMGGISAKDYDSAPVVGRIAAAPDTTKNRLSDESPRQRRK